MWQSLPAAFPTTRLLLAVLLFLPACAENEAEPVRRPLVAPAPGSVSTAGLPRVSIGSESRYVLAEHARSVLRDEPIVLPDGGNLAVEVRVPASPERGDLRLEGWVSVRDPEAAHATLLDLREGTRLHLRAASRALPADSVDPAATLVIPVPELARGQAGRLTVIARRLAPASIETITLAEQSIPAGSRLRFGYAVEAPGWEEGSPPVRVAVSSSEAGGAPELLFERRLDPAADPRDRRWFDAEIDLAALAGRQIALSFIGEALGDASSRSFPVFSAPEIVSTGSQERKRRNLVLISLDTLRARSVGAYGAPRPTTPSLDRRLADAGARVRRAVTPFPFTPPAHMSMLTGLTPCAHAVLQPGRDVLAAENPTLAEALRAAGYHTAAFTEDAYVVAAAGFDRGFDSYVENRSEETASPGFARETFGAAESWLAARADRPFFLFIHTYQVHDPYAPPRGYRTLFGEGDAGDANQQALTNYEREIRYTDDVLADFLDLLDARGLADSTIVVVTSDHGEGFGEHFWTQHGNDLHDEALLVPFVVRAPALVPAGRVVEEQISLTDVTPTLLALLDLPVPPDLQGRSFAGLLTGRESFRERPILATTVTRPGQDRPLSTALRKRNSKYIVIGEEEFLYDLAADPEEKQNRAATDPSALAEARAELAAEQAACERWQSARPAAPRVPSGPDDQPGWLVNRQELDEAIVHKLRSLGYTQ